MLLRGNLLRNLGSAELVEMGLEHPEVTVAHDPLPLRTHPTSPLEHAPPPCRAGTSSVRAAFAAGGPDFLVQPPGRCHRCHADLDAEDGVQRFRYFRHLGGTEVHIGTAAQELRDRVCGGTVEGDRPPAGLGQPYWLGVWGTRQEPLVVVVLGRGCDR